MNKNLLTGIIIGLSLGLAVAAGVFYSSNKKALAPAHPELQSMPKENNVPKNYSNSIPNQENIQEFSKSEGWTEITHDNFWNNPKLFSTSKYKFAGIKFSHPPGWKFSCCNDMDHASTHIIYSSTEYLTSEPMIVITDYSLVGCKDGVQCSIDQVVSLTANDKYEQLIKSLPQEAIVLGEKNLSNLDIDAFVYETVLNNGEKTKSYILNLSDDVVQIDFEKYELLGDEIIDEFLGKIFWDR